MKSTRWLPRIVVIAAITIGIVMVLMWQQDRGLKTIETRLDAGDATGALAELDSFLASHPEHGRATALRARALVLVGQAQQAVQLFDRIGAAELADLRAWSEALLQLQQWKQAEPILERTLQLEPGDAETLQTLTICRFEQGDYLGALDSSRLLAALPGHEAAGHMQLASIHRDGGYRVTALQHYKKVLQYRPDATGLPMLPAAFFLIYGDTLVRTGDARRALEMLERSEKLKRSVDVTLKQGQAWQLIGDFEKAAEHLEKVLGENPTNRLALEALAEIALQQGDTAKAIERLQALVECDSLTATSAYLFQRAYTLLDEDAKAEQWQQKTSSLRAGERRFAALKVSVQKDPLGSSAKIVAAYQAAKEKNWSQAGQILAVVLRQSPESYEQAFVQQLVEAVRRRGTLPAIDTYPGS